MAKENPPSEENGLAARSLSRDSRNHGFIFHASPYLTTSGHPHPMVNDYGRGLAEWDEMNARNIENLARNGTAEKGEGVNYGRVYLYLD